MAIRTTSAAVKGVLLRDYDTVNNPSLDPFILAASIVIDDIAACAVAKGEAYSAERLEVMERFLAADNYMQNDPKYKRKRTERAEGEFWETSYVKNIKMMDPLGCLAEVVDGVHFLQGVWLGTAKGDERSYDERQYPDGD